MTVETRPATIESRPKTVRETLLHAALLIEERGWCQGHYESPDGRLCMTGAIKVAAGQRADQWPDSDFAFAAMRPVYKSNAGGEIWNDTPGRTAAEVIAALRAAAETA